MMILRKIYTPVIFFLSSTCSFVYAGIPEVETHGFFSMGYAITDSSAAYLNSITNQGDYTYLSDAGIQFGSSLTDRLSAKIQFVSEGRTDQTFIPRLDLAQVKYEIKSGIDVILGQIRLPLFMISDYRMVGALYPW